MNFTKSYQRVGGLAPHLQPCTQSICQEIVCKKTIYTWQVLNTNTTTPIWPGILSTSIGHNHTVCTCHGSHTQTISKGHGLKAQYKNLQLTQNLEYQCTGCYTFHLPRDLIKTTAPDGRSYTLTISMQHRLLNTSILHIDNFYLAGDLTQTIYHLTWWRTLNSSTEQDNFPPAQGSCADNFRLTEALKYKHRTRQFTTCPLCIRQGILHTHAFDSTKAFK